MSLPAPFDAWLGSFPWLRERGLSCIISPDLDGLACGLFQQRHLGWKIKGTYDGKALCLWDAPESIEWSAVVFLDLEIMRPDARCIGNHMLAIDSEHAEALATNFRHCANPNIWRGFNAWDSFQRKYPFGTLPLLIASHICENTDFVLDRIWLALLLQTDSAFTNAAMYQTNALDWLRAMGGEEPLQSPHPVSRLCTLLRRLPAQSALKLIEHVQQMAAQAGFGARQRACRFDSREDKSRGKAAELAGAVAKEVATDPPDWLRVAPVFSEVYQTSVLPADSKKALRNSLACAQANGVLSMAITGATKEGFSYTLGSVDSPIALLRRTT
ncbi:MAG: hypothetical protein KF699_03975 [Phycisphaeraceae bacterium]|nr:hypothetical protein [Phycisphaeraceae bacterium]